MLWKTNGADCVDSCIFIQYIFILRVCSVLYDDDLKIRVFLLVDAEFILNVGTGS